MSYRFRWLLSWSLFLFGLTRLGWLCSLDNFSITVRQLWLREGASLLYTLSLTVAGFVCILCCDFEPVRSKQGRNTR